MGAQPDDLYRWTCPRCGLTVWLCAREGVRHPCPNAHHREIPMERGDDE